MRNILNSDQTWAWQSADGCFMGEVDVVVAVVPPALHDLDSLGRDKSVDTQVRSLHTILITTTLSLGYKGHRESP